MPGILDSLLRQSPEQPATINPSLLAQVTRMAQTPRPQGILAQLGQQGPQNWTEYGQQFRQNLAGQFPSGGDPLRPVSQDEIHKYLGLLSIAPAGILAGAGAKTANLAKLQAAQQLEKSGVKGEQIWKETGWFKGVDGKWRFEIPDDAARLIENRTVRDFMSGPGPAEYPVGPISNVLDHPQLSAAYPDVMGIDAMIVKGGSSSYIPNTGFGEGFNLQSSGTKQGALHELQHAIQKREGFSKGGGSDSEAYRRLAGEIEARLVQQRANMTPAQRAASYPPSMYDVPIDKQIVR